MRSCKIIFFLVVVVLCPVSNAVAQAPCDGYITLAWDPPDPTWGIIGYNIYVGTESGVYPNPPIDVGNVTTYTVKNLYDPTVYFFVCTAYTESGVESYPSNEVSGEAVGDKIAPSTPTGVKCVAVK